MLTLTEVKTSTLSEQILDVFPSGSYALSGLLRLLDIVETESVPTAAVECLAQPRLLINPKFVAAHAETPEKLLMLVMHELHHVLLGHTTLFPRNTPTQNFVFDAVINGILCRMFPGAEYTAFFTDYYSATSFPECLLRPPVGWPGRVDTNEAEWQVTDPAARERIQEVHAALYSKSGASYFEVYQLLPRLLKSTAKDAKDAKDISAEQADVSDIPLLGEHRAATEDGKLEHTSPVLFDIVRDLVEQWPQPPDPINGRSLAEVMTTSTISPQRKNPTNRALLRSLICKVADQRVAGRLLRRRPEATPTVTAIPTFSRRGAVLQALGVQVLLYPGAVNWPKTIPLVITVGEGVNRFNVFHAEFFGDDMSLDRPSYSGQVRERFLWGRALIQNPRKKDLHHGLSTSFCGHTPVKGHQQIGLRLCESCGHTDHR